MSWQFTILLLNEIKRQLVKAPLAAAISLYLISPTQPMHEMLDEIRDKDGQPHRELRPLLFSRNTFFE